MKTNKNKLSKSEIEQKIKDVFSKENPPKEDIRKIKKLAMSKNIRLSDYKKKFCKKCLSYFNPNNSEIRIKKGFKTVKCKECDNVSRWRMR